MTSSSNSCQPATDSSSSTCVMGLQPQAVLDDAREALLVVGDAAAAAAQRVGGADDEREAELAGGRLGLVHRLRQALRGTRRPISSMAVRNSRRSSARWMAFVVGADHLDLPEVEHAGAP